MLGNFVCIEGYDGSGKTTVAKYLAKQYGYEYIKSPSGVFSEVRDEFDTANISVDDRIAFYLGDCIHISESVRTIINNGGTVVCDRYYYSTIAYHEYRENGAFNDYWKYISALYQPENVILVIAHKQTIINRLKDRGEEAHEKLYDPQNAIERIYDIYKNIINIPYIELHNDMSRKILYSKIDQLQNCT